MPRSLIVLAQVLRCRAIIRLEVAFAAFNLAEYGVWVTVLVYAYERGGTVAAAAVAVAQLVPAGLLAARLAMFLRRRRASAALQRGHAIQTVSLTLLAASLLGGVPVAFVYMTAVLAASAVTLTRPAQSVLVPKLVATHNELTAVNVISGWVESICVLAGPVLAGVMMAIAGPGAAICMFAAATALAALVCPVASGVPATSPSAGDPTARGPRELADEPDRVATRPPALADVAAGHVVWFLATAYVVVGIVDVAAVVLAARVLSLGHSGAAYLTAAFGAGGIAGAAIAVTLIGRRSLDLRLCTAGAAWSAIMAVLGLTASRPGAFALLACAGAARAVLDTCGRTILMCTASASTRPGLFARLEAFTMFGLALGSLLVAPLDAAGGAPAPLEGAAALLAFATLANVAQMRHTSSRASSHPHTGPPPPHFQTVALATRER